MSDGNGSDPRNDGDPTRDDSLDTIAQKPTEIGAGAPVSPPAPDADADNADPMPGAQPTLTTTGTEIRKGHDVAAGLPAVYQSVRFTIREMGALRGVIPRLLARRAYRC